MVLGEIGHDDVQATYPFSAACRTLETHEAWDTNNHAAESPPREALIGAGSHIPHDLPPFERIAKFDYALHSVLTMRLKVQPPDDPLGRACRMVGRDGSAAGSLFFFFPDPLTRPSRESGQHESS